MTAGAYDWTDDMLKIKSMQKKFRDSFNGTEINPTRWDVAASGSGMALTVADGTVTISTGTTLDDEVVLTSRTAFTIPLRVMVAVNLSQRIAGQSVWLELVSVDPTSAQPDGRSAAAWRLDGTSPTLANYEVQSEGAPRLASSSGSPIPTTVPTGWSVLEIEPTNDECWFHGRQLDTTAARSNSYVRHQQIPEPNALYRFRIRVRNRQFINGISAVANNGSGLVRITRAAHGFATNDVVTVADVSGVPGANGTFTITVIDANSFDLVGSTFSGAYLNTGWASVSRNLAPASMRSRSARCASARTASRSGGAAARVDSDGAAGAGLGVVVTVISWGGLGGADGAGAAGVSGVVSGMMGSSSGRAGSIAGAGRPCSPRARTAASRSTGTGTTEISKGSQSTARWTVSPVATSGRGS
ncbi:ubiquitin-activating E1 FCCH domain-containing protein [Siccirubricoccus phaeus]|uniref:ubiquitin-activating E1 FCCH domain-containing protein n=1 Tax=Siccirubricoccus phaeus TaxID=2595053 RepID=UPI001F29626D|nr:ubiquitin-activating E1 FCCH domain-containing protein [Siccirubricoccus phaeus]